jgi:acyl carrier protein
MKQNGSINSVSVESLKSWLCGWLGEELESDPTKLDPGQTFLSYGLDSVQAMSMVGDLESKLRMRLAPTLAWDYPTIDALAEHLAGRFSVEAIASLDAAQSIAKPVASRAEIESLLAGIDQIEDQEVDRLLAQYLGQST